MIPDEKSLNVPTIRHPDLSPDNIFISEAGEITGVIDWQHSVAMPLFLQAKLPRHFQNYGDDESEKFQPPKLPDDFEKLADTDKEVQLEVYRRRQLHYFYLGFPSTDNPSHFDALSSPGLILRNETYESASKPWEGDNITLKANLIRVVEQWERIRCASSSDCIRCPLNYNEPETKQVLELDEKQKAAADSSQRLRDIVGVNIDGWVPLEDFDDVVDRAASVRAQMLEQPRQIKRDKRLHRTGPLTITTKATRYVSFQSLSCCDTYCVGTLQYHRAFECITFKCASPVHSTLTECATTTVGVPRRCSLHRLCAISQCTIPPEAGTLDTEECHGLELIGKIIFTILSCYSNTHYEPCQCH